MLSLKYLEENYFNKSTQYPRQGRWMSRKVINPSGYQGFIYCIQNIESDKYYIGKKNFKIGGKSYHMRNGKRVKNTRKGMSSNWMEYSSSSTSLNKDIKKLGEDLFYFYHLISMKTVGGLTYAEASIQHHLRVLEDQERYYNLSIDKIRFIPKEIYKL